MSTRDEQTNGVLASLFQQGPSTADLAFERANSAYDRVITYPHRNLIINGSGQVNQLGTGLIADDNYSFDQWIILTESNSVTTSQLTNVQDGIPTMMRATQSNAVGQRMGMLQIVETNNCRHTRGKQVTLSANVRSSISANVRYAIIEHVGTEDVVLSDIVNDWSSTSYIAGGFFISTNTVVANTNSTTLTPNVVTSISMTASLTSNLNNLMVIFWSESQLAQNSTIDIGCVQLELGNVATQTEFRDYATEFQMCQRYIQTFIYRSGRPGLRINGYASAVGAVRLSSYMLPVKTRTDGPVGIILGTWITANCGQPAVAITSDCGIELYVTSTAVGEVDCYPDVSTGLLISNVL
jgi:hypothetical protein